MSWPRAFRVSIAILFVGIVVALISGNNQGAGLGIYTVGAIATIVTGVPTVWVWFRGRRASRL